ncbi:MAG TPA: hypothetical protein VLQ91_20750 [Draconibacterium sp.]|nr:hypothetical protein [Draconibacterium sp.]
MTGLISLAQKKLISSINFGTKAGASKLNTEIPYDFSETINEFENKVGISYALEISKFIFPHWEIGFEWNYSVLNGETYSPSFSATGFHPIFMEPINEPVEYRNQLSGPAFFFRYYFKTVTKEVLFNPFIRIGYGSLHYTSALKYIDSGEVIFGKGGENGASLITPAFNLGTGFRTSLSSRIYLISSVDFNIVDYDFLDVMHNYDTEGNRLKLFGLYTGIKIGVFYNMFLYMPGKGRKAKYSSPVYAPFARKKR